MGTQGGVRTIVIRERSNSVGLAGFICSLVGLFASCGLLSPVGMVLSFFGMFKPPRGLAVAGFILGLVGSVWLFLVLFVIGVGAVLAFLGWNQMAVTMDATQIGAAVEQYRAEKGALPPTLDVLPNATKLPLTDPWGTPYRYKADASGGFTLSSDGPDKVGGTADDITAGMVHSTGSGGGTGT